MNPELSHCAKAANTRKTNAAHPASFIFHYRVFAASDDRLATPICCKLLHSVAGPDLEAGIVANCCRWLQTVAGTAKIQIMDRPHEPRKNRAQLPTARSLADTPPRTKTGQVVWAWPEISAGLKSGRTMREVWEALQVDGLVMPYNQFRVYVSRTRKRLGTADRKAAQLSSETMRGNGESAVGAATDDPLANIRRELERKRSSGFFYDPGPDEHV